MSARLGPPGLDLGVGALVVYGGHGLGRVTATTATIAPDTGAAVVVVEFKSGLSVTLPLERAEACLRPPADATEVAAVRATLRAQESLAEQSWQSRTITARAKITLGDPVSLAEVVRDAVERQRRFAARSGLSGVEQELYRKARRLLAAELALAVNSDEAEAEAWIGRQLDRSGE